MKRLLLLIALSIGASMAIADHDKTANYNSATGELELPRVSVDGGKATYSVTLQNRAHSIGDYVFDLKQDTVTLSTSDDIYSDPIVSGKKFTSGWAPLDVTGDQSVYVTRIESDKEQDWKHFDKFPNLLTKQQLKSLGNSPDDYDNYPSNYQLFLNITSQYWARDGNGRTVCNWDAPNTKWQCGDWTVNTDKDQRHAAVVYCVPGHECKNHGDYEEYGGTPGSPYYR
ncbi:MAG: hypothetical protein HOH69_13570 [Gammaproteobacteria bacterium]|jgi:hypothetical protein|nr:hypothetical protein [Gammaproteobacteria bacterium]